MKKSADELSPEAVAFLLRMGYQKRLEVYIPSLGGWVGCGNCAALDNGWRNPNLQYREWLYQPRDPV